MARGFFKASWVVLPLDKLAVDRLTVTPDFLHPTAAIFFANIKLQLFNDTS